MRKEVNTKPTDQICQQVGMKMSIIMREKSITSKQLSVRTGIDSGDVSRYRSGKIVATLLTVDKIATGLGVKPAVLFEK